jgi:CubicO group peptidase (beta-lactamase class C family)
MDKHLHSRRQFGRRAVCSFTLLIAFMLASAAPAQASVQPPAVLTPESLERFFDVYMEKQMVQTHVPGAVVAVVKDGEIVFSKGYGLADVEHNIPYTPDRSLSRIASVTKLFTWTAVMQLAEQGKLDLDADINTYLDFQIPDTYPQPITLKHLMSHSAGFEDANHDISTADPSRIRKFDAMVKTHVPARVRPPGQFSAYSNYGANLAGYIVQRVSGMSWQDYITKHILAPLEMTSTTPYVPLPPALARNAAKGYLFKDGLFTASPPVYLHMPASGAMSATANDIARFMIAHLQNGRLGEARILLEDTARLMHSPLFTNDPRVNGFAHGFYEMSQHGKRIIGHAGDVTEFHSILALFPEEKLGLFVAYNSVNAGMKGLTEETLKAFMDRFFGKMRPTTPMEWASSATRVAGAYRGIRMNYSGLEKAIALFSPVNFTAQANGSLIYNAPAGQKRLLEVAPLLFKSEDGYDVVAFREDANGNITHAFDNARPMNAMERYPVGENPRASLLLLGGGLMVMLSVLVAGAGSAIRNHYTPDELGGHRPAPSRALRGATLSIVAAAVLSIVFVVFFTLGYANQNAFVQGETLLVRIALVCSTLIVALTPFLLIGLYPVWRAKWPAPARAHYTLGVVALLGLAYVFVTWHLVGWQF